MKKQYLCTMNSINIFSLALDLNRPWTISNIEFVERSSKEKELHIYIDFERGFRFASTSGEKATTYDTVNKRC